MMRLILFALLVAAAWYGWHHYPELLSRLPGHEIVIVNQTGHSMERIRATIDGKTYVRESLADGQRGSMPFKVVNESSIDLTWEYGDQMGERHWNGGMVPRGPMTQRHIITILQDGEVNYTTENKT